MIVVDASVAIDVLLQVPESEALTERLLAGGETLHAPHLLTRALPRHTAPRISHLRRRSARDY